MKKPMMLLITAMICLALGACHKGIESPETTAASAIPTTAPAIVATTAETEPITYAYDAEPMQNAQCIYYPPDAYVPNAPDPDSIRGKIRVWTQCPTCGKENVGSYMISPEELDFSAGDTAVYYGTDSCWDCRWDRDIDQFMWMIQVTRIPE